ncbi:hypothetical protein Kpol_1030p4 [Vanderwaltozyma polyspora DSM 70294]|uniref:Uncharacterized protein n=1 Tax=Vanderwaltozyma polyspora (strain ATCC 22028 / DSM 70294 / BCRC 21397 / CBS 2163 / NBRC 10782 / NRRL Y-8283 / UCD 57-17) TaxID=436907 RepID=A7TMS4_VANPO|nr:uncharacterized protein Kpol_1030p4 [Vanderwaltozyma polyspora DSM 70294]EDO16396.1 hypothetical protein Kpol_1030p4 [Vanderwaltozyma polyspora DSM 70294]
MINDNLESTNHGTRPKVSVKTHESLFLLNYSDIPKFNDQSSNLTIKQFNIYVYIDIPTIDYYNDQLVHNKLWKFNKKFKLSKIKNLLFDSFVNENDNIWNTLVDNNTQINISISSSGSIRYVETIKFLIENTYTKIFKLNPNFNFNDNLNFDIEVSPISKKWFNSFLDKHLINQNLIKFIDIINYQNVTRTNPTNPFKEYFSKLNFKFITNGNDKSTFDTISVVTNSTGVKALLTILSDRPIFSYISEESVDLLKSLQYTDTNSGTTYRRRSDSLDSCGSSEDDTSLKRESSSIMSFQNNLLTSNKDRSVRIRSLSINRNIGKSQVFNFNDMTVLPNHRSELNDIEYNTNNTDSQSINSMKAVAFPEKFQVGGDSSETEFDNDLDDDDDDEEDEEDDETLDNEQGLTLNVPSKLSRASSHVDVTNMRPTNPVSTTKKNRFRSLSLMDPPYKVPFVQTIKNNTNNINLSNSQIITQPQPQRLDQLACPSILTENKDDDEDDEDEIYNITDNEETKRVTNIYIHDGEFEDVMLQASSPYARRNKKRSAISNSVSVDSSAGNNLIPPEFYSRISSPSLSANSSNTSIHNMQYATMSKLDDSSSQSKLFEKNLITKSFEELRKQPSMNSLFSTLIGGYNNDIANPLALNFRSKTRERNATPLLSYKGTQMSSPIYDEEDLMMSGFDEQNPLHEQYTLDLTDCYHSNSDEQDEYGTTDIETLTSKRNSVMRLTDDLSNTTHILEQDENNGDSHSDKSTKNNQFDLNLNLNFKLDVYDKKQNESIDPNKDKPRDSDSQPEIKHKKAFTIDLYGDDDIDNSYAWVLGGNI